MSEPALPLPAVASALVGTPPPRRRRRGGVTVLVVLLVAAVGLAAYLMLAATQWRTTSQRWAALARTHGLQVAQAQADLDAASTELASTREQLATAQDRITELADEKARLGDTTAAQRQLADYQARVSKAAGTVATSLASCVSAQQRLIGYLDDKNSYDPTSLQTFADQVTALCAQATSANDALQSELAK